MLNVYLKQRSKYRFVDGVSVLYNHSTSYLTVGARNWCVSVLLVDRPFNPVSSKPRVFPVFSVSALLVDGSH
jgi:hypothetical protein